MEKGVEGVRLGGPAEMLAISQWNRRTAVVVVVVSVCVVLGVVVLRKRVVRRWRRGHVYVISHVHLKHIPPSTRSSSSSSAGSSWRWAARLIAGLIAGTIIEHEVGGGTNNSRTSWGGCSATGCEESHKRGWWGVATYTDLASGGFYPVQSLLSLVLQTSSPRTLVRMGNEAGAEAEEEQAKVRPQRSFLTWSV